MILQALLTTKLDAPFATPGSWDGWTTYAFSNDPEYGDSSYPMGYRDLWGSTVRTPSAQSQSCSAVRCRTGMEGNGLACLGRTSAHQQPWLAMVAPPSL
jgi:hypothetical protein